MPAEMVNTDGLMEYIVKRFKSVKLNFINFATSDTFVQTGLYANYWQPCTHNAIADTDTRPIS